MSEYKTSAKQREYALTYHRKHRAKILPRQRAYTKALRGDPIKRLTRDVRRFGITASEYLGLHAKQFGVCAICSREETHQFKGKVQRLAVDHDHVSGAIRGLLCRNCNIAIGLLGNCPERLRLASAYLENVSI